MNIGILGLSGRSLFFSCGHFHAEGETLTADAFWQEPGGKGYNQAVAARRLGAQVTYLTCLGQDAAGRQCRDVLEREGVCCLAQTTALPTACACILTDPEGRNRVTVYPGAAARLNEAFLARHAEQLAACQLFLLNLECPLPVVNAAIQLAERLRIPVILNPAPALALPLKTLRRLFLLTPNQQEAHALLRLRGEVPPAQLARCFFAHGFAQVVVTLGSRGALVARQGHAWLYPCLPVRPVDTTGAGDCFSAALAVALGQGQSLEQAAVFAVNAAAYSVARPHVLAGLPTLAALEPLHPVEPVCLF